MHDPNSRDFHPIYKNEFTATWWTRIPASLSRAHARIVGALYILHQMTANCRRPHIDEWAAERFGLHIFRLGALTRSASDSFRVVADELVAAANGITEQSLNVVHRRQYEKQYLFSTSAHEFAYEIAEGGFNWITEAVLLRVRGYWEQVAGADAAEKYWLLGRVPTRQELRELPGRHARAADLTMRDMLSHAEVINSIPQRFVLTSEAVDRLFCQMRQELFRAMNQRLITGRKYPGDEEAADHDATITDPAPITLPDKETHAVSLLLDPRFGPNAKKIAEEIGVPRTTLISWPRFELAYRRMKADCEQQKQSRRKGTKSLEPVQKDHLASRLTLR